jgi:hypothetical protein
MVLISTMLKEKLQHVLVQVYYLQGEQNVNFKRPVATGKLLFVMFFSL